MELQAVVPRSLDTEKLQPEPYPAGEPAWNQTWSHNLLLAAPWMKADNAGCASTMSIAILNLLSMGQMVAQSADGGKLTSVHWHASNQSPCHAAED
jgi:hypothetical protein